MSSNVDLIYQLIQNLNQTDKEQLKQMLNQSKKIEVKDIEDEFFRPVEKAGRDLYLSSYKHKNRTDTFQIGEIDYKGFEVE